MFDPNLTIGIFLLTTLGVTVKIYQDNKKKVSYTSFDRYKKEVEEKMQTKEICGIMHTRLLEDLKEIKLDVKQLLRNGSNES